MNVLVFFVNLKRLSFFLFCKFFLLHKVWGWTKHTQFVQIQSVSIISFSMHQKKPGAFTISDIWKKVEHDISQLKFKKLLVFKYWSGNNQVGNMPANHLPHSNAAAHNVLNAFQSKSRAPSNATNASLPGSSITRGSVVDPCWRMTK